MAATHLSILNSMADFDFPKALDKHVAWGLTHLDLKDMIFEKPVTELSPTEAGRAAEAIQSRGLGVYCLSSSLFGGDIEDGPDAFRARALEPLGRLLNVARVLRPRLIRLLAAHSSRRAEFADSADYLDAQQPWVWGCYREAIDRIHDAGFLATVENEAYLCLLSTPGEIAQFFAKLDRPGKVVLTWDVQNLWQMGSFPSLETYGQIAPWLGYYHVKGGRGDGPQPALTWRSGLEEATWPVVEITRQVIAEGRSPVICLNPPHGALPPGQPDEHYTERDLAFLRRSFPEIV